MIQQSWRESMQIAKDKGQRETQGLFFGGGRLGVDQAGGMVGHDDWFT